MLISVHSARQSAEGSISQRMRRRRFARFAGLVERAIRAGTGPVSIIDIGGTQGFWERHGWADRQDIRVTLVNIHPQNVTHPNFVSIQSDATNLPHIPDNSFDIAMSNSVIEHVFTLDNQRAMAREITRVARAYWVQTPSYWFPVEPHFLAPGWQWLPRDLRVALLRRFRFGNRGPVRDPERATAQVDEIRLMTRAELSACFPGSTLIPEYFCGLVKSWTAVGGFESLIAQRASAPSTTEIVVPRTTTRHRVA